MKMGKMAKMEKMEMELFGNEVVPQWYLRIRRQSDPGRVCGLEVHKDSIKACVRVPGQDQKREQVIATFGTKTADLLALRDWPEQWQVTHVGMESSDEVLEAGVLDAGRPVSDDTGQCRAYQECAGA